MAAQPWLIAVDIDGTLLSSAGLVLPGTRAEFARARSAGATIALVSGRPLIGLRRLVQRTQLDPRGLVLIGLNGAISADAMTGELIADHVMNGQIVRDIVTHARAHGITSLLCVGDDVLVDEPDHFRVGREIEGNGLRLRVVPSLPAANEADLSVNKVLMTAEPDVLRAFGQAFPERFGDVVESSFSAGFYFEATAAGVDKGTALADLAARREMNLSDAVAFGDNNNDLPMIEAVGLGVAMANGTKQLRAAADRVTASNNDEGIAAVLADLFGQGQPAPPVPEVQADGMYHGFDVAELGGLVHPADS